MARLPILAAVALALCACTTVERQQVLQDLQHCDRRYEGVIATASFGAPGFSGKVDISCKALPPSVPPTP